jgi:hypothetical protein
MDRDLRSFEPLTSRERDILALLAQALLVARGMAEDALPFGFFVSAQLLGQAGRQAQAVELLSFTEQHPGSVCAGMRCQSS